MMTLYRRHGGSVGVVGKMKAEVILRWTLKTANFDKESFGARRRSSG